MTGKEVERRQALEVVLAGPAFSRSPRMSRFLRHVVEAVLRKDDGALKETAIGVAVFDRPPEYDPKIDPVVRNEARRLRATLERHYATDGVHDAVCISIPKGGYRPQFNVRGATEKPAEKIAETAAETPRPAAAPPIGHRLWITAGIAAASALLAVAATAAVLGRAHSDAATLPLVRPLTTFPDRELHPTVAPDNAHIAFSWNRNGNYDIFIKPMHGSGDVPIQLTTDPADELRPAWSPDGRSLAFARASGVDAFDIVVAHVNGGPERTITRIENLDDGGPAEDRAAVLRTMGNPGPAWSPDGTSLVVTGPAATSGGRALQLVPVDRGGQPPPRILTHPPAGAFDFFPAFSRDGEWLAFARRRTHSTYELYVVPVQGGDERRLAFDDGDIQGLAWAPDGRSLIASKQLPVLPLQSRRDARIVEGAVHEGR